MAGRRLDFSISTLVFGGRDRGKPLDWHPDFRQPDGLSGWPLDPGSRGRVHHVNRTVPGEFENPPVVERYVNGTFGRQLSALPHHFAIKRPFHQMRRALYPAAHDETIAVHRHGTGSAVLARPLLEANRGADTHEILCPDALGLDQSPTV